MHGHDVAIHFFFFLRTSGCVFMSVPLSMWGQRTLSRSQTSPSTVQLRRWNSDQQAWCPVPLPAEQSCSLVHICGVNQQDHGEPGISTHCHRVWKAAL